ncbi:magnesium/cobalt transporter CorA [Bacteroides sedimenti]|uniref:Magnesium transport protein CorA n=1 Tax=Bacteroides sedimenti TaxID=2136147 RepID=A0ABM8IGE9_9BACE
MKNNLLSEKLTYTGVSTTPTHLHLCSYNESEVNEFSGFNFSDIRGNIQNDRINWIQVNGMQNIDIIREIGDYYNINFLTIQDILNPHHPTKIEEHENHHVLVLKLFQAEKNNQLIKQQLSIIQGKNFILTFLENDGSLFDDVITAIQNNILKIRSKESDYLLSVLLNDVMANYRNIITAVEESLEEMESRLLTITSATDIGINIQTSRRQYMRVKRAVLPLKEQFSRLLLSDSKLLHKSNRAYFYDVNDHLQFVLQTIEICRETLSSLVDLYISNNDLRMNDIMKRLTVVSTIFIPLTFLVGVWGMNFKIMPELDWKYGYLTAWLIMIIVGFIGYWFFKKKKWY